ncbi:MAG: MvaI/BcnI family restriction endonuclease [Candidatus Cloacimonetes bacterium]|nr:MvaI/BcnI family restriction endonuclease [Candidatus Cloacimonadota bacterium]
MTKKHAEWLDSVSERIGLDDLSPVPYWGFRDIAAHVGAKLINCFYVFVDVKREKGKEYLKYGDIKMLSTFSMTKFIDAIENNLIYIDFDARTGHNHGTKFRIRESNIWQLYDKVTLI